MATRNPPRILCVDDEPQILLLLARMLSDDYAVTTAASGAEAIKILRQQGPFAVIVADMRMPVMDGVTLLKHALQIAPFTVRVLLTGWADLQTAAAAVNEGQLFRFLTKPCEVLTLRQDLDAAVRRHRQMGTERALLERTLHGTVQLLTDLLAAAQPEAFARAARLRQYVDEIVDALKLEDRWYFDVAAMLSQLGAVTLPVETVAKVYSGRDLATEELALLERQAAFTADLLGHVPRLEPVRDCLMAARQRYDGVGSPAGSAVGERLPLGARILKIVLDFDELHTGGSTPVEAMRLMQGRSGHYDPRLLAAFCQTRTSTKYLHDVCELPLAAVVPGMVFVEDVRAANGALLITQGQAMTAAFAKCLQGPRVRGIPDLVRVCAPWSSAPPGTWADWPLRQ